jgi:hypothetical protein
MVYYLKTDKLWKESGKSQTQLCVFFSYTVKCETPSHLIKENFASSCIVFRTSNATSSGISSF